MLRSYIVTSRDIYFKHVSSLYRLLPDLIFCCFPIQCKVFKLSLLCRMVPDIVIDIQFLMLSPLCTLVPWVVVSLFGIDFSLFFLYVLIADLSMSSNFSTVVSFELLNLNHELCGAQFDFQAFYCSTRLTLNLCFSLGEEPGGIFNTKSFFFNTFSLLNAYSRSFA